MLVELQELIWLLRLSLHLPALFHLVVTLYLISLFKLDVASTGVRGPAESAATIEGLQIVLTEVTAGGDAAGRGKEGRAIIAVRGVGACRVLALDGGLGRFEVDAVLALACEFLAGLVRLAVVAVELLHLLDDAATGFEIFVAHLFRHINIEPKEAILDACIGPEVPLHSSTNSSSSLELFLNLDSVTSIILESMQLPMGL